MSALLHVEKRPATGATSASTLPLVLLHGWGMNLRVFDLLRDAVGDEHQTWAIDLPGHGRSAWREAQADFEVQLHDVLAALPARCVLLGWSLGGKFAMEIAAREPARVAALVLISASPRFRREADWPHGIDAQALRAFQHALQQDWSKTLDDFVWLQLRGSRDAEAARDLLQRALAQHGAPRPEALRAGLELLATLDLRGTLPAIHQPVLMISGQNDRVTPPAALRWMQSLLPQATHVELPRAGHASFISHHAEVAAALRTFLHQHAQVIAA
jgi:pimeloyl-[acyl-carrier protein] methyl ester esterase